MRKFAANYLFNDAGILLKNGIVYADDEGNAVRFLDTKGDLRETDLLAFHNGILMAGCIFIRNKEVGSIPENRISETIFESVLELIQLSIQNIIELSKQIQQLFPEMTIPEILNEIRSILQLEGGFIQESLPGIYLLSGVNLPDLKFTSKSRIKKIF